MSKEKPSTKDIDALQQRTDLLISHLERETPRLKRARNKTRGAAAVLIRAARARDGMVDTSPTSTRQAVGMNRDALATSPLLDEMEAETLVAADNIRHEVNRNLAMMRATPHVMSKKQQHKADRLHTKMGKVLGSWRRTNKSRKRSAPLKPMPTVEEYIDDALAATQRRRSVNTDTAQSRAAIRGLDINHGYVHHHRQSSPEIAVRRHLANKKFRSTPEREAEVRRMMGDIEQNPDNLLLIEAGISPIRDDDDDEVEGEEIVFRPQAVAVAPRSKSRKKASPKRKAHGTRKSKGADLDARLAALHGTPVKRRGKKSPRQTRRRRRSDDDETKMTAPSDEELDAMVAAAIAEAEAADAMLDAGTPTASPLREEEEEELELELGQLHDIPSDVSPIVDGSEEEAALLAELAEMEIQGGGRRKRRRTHKKRHRGKTRRKRKHKRNRKRRKRHTRR